MTVNTINRMGRGMDYPSLVGKDSGPLNLIGVLEAPGTAFQNKSYGMAGLGDLTNIGGYFTSENYYLGYVGLALLGYYFLFSGPSRSSSRRTSRRATLKGVIAREQELLKGA